MGVCSFALSLFALLLKIATVTDLLSSLFKNSNHKRITLVAFNKRVTVSDSLCKKEQHKWFARDSSESLSKTSNSIEKVQFLFNVFDSFSLPFPFFFIPNSESLLSLIALTLFIKSDGGDSLLTKEWQWAICSFSRENCSSLTKTHAKKLT